MIPETIFARTLRRFLAPVQDYLDDPTVCEVLINGPSRIYVERAGRLELAPARFDSPEDLEAAIRNLAQYSGRFVDASRPILEARLPDGSRVEAVLPPAAPQGPCIAIRKFTQAAVSLRRFVDSGSMSLGQVRFLAAAMARRRNLVISGGTGSGKTSLLAALAGLVPETQRIVVIEDSREIEVPKPHVVYLEGRPPDARNEGEISIRQLFRATLRLRPDRIIVGEVRGGEALDMIQAMTSGHGGCLTTVHGSSPADALRRIETLCLMSDVELPLAALRHQVASAVNVVVQTARMSDGQRKVTHIAEVRGVEPRQGYLLRPILLADPTDGSAPGAEQAP